MVLGEGENFFSREKPNVGFGVLPFPKPQPLSRKAEYFFAGTMPCRRLFAPFLRKAECFFSRDTAPCCIFAVPKT